MFTWRVSTYAQQSPVDAVLDKGHVVLEDLLDIDDVAKVLCILLMDSSRVPTFITAQYPAVASTPIQPYAFDHDMQMKLLDLIGCVGLCGMAWGTTRNAGRP